MCFSNAINIDAAIIIIDIMVIMMLLVILLAIRQYKKTFQTSRERVNR